MCTISAEKASSSPMLVELTYQERPSLGHGAFGKGHDGAVAPPVR